MRALRVIACVVVIGCGPKQLDRPDEGGPDASVDMVCTPGQSEACYNGPVGTMNVGSCVGGTRTCTDQGLWTACDGEILPVAETCGNGIDENCSGAADEDLDEDGDGFTTCGGDCCDNPQQGCASPNLVNPGAFEAAGNLVDDDCDGQVDNAIAAACDMALATNSSVAMDYAKAMDLCQTADPTELKWGVVSAELVRASGTGAPNANQHSIRPAFGGTTVQGGLAFTVLSTGHAAAVGQTQPSYSDFQTAAGLGTTSAFPADFIAAHGGTLPNTPGCPALAAGTTANDPVMLQMQIRVPTNARSFSFKMNFLSSEYPEWTCSPYNDFFVVLLDSTFAGTPPNPADKNLAFYNDGATSYPVGVNLAFGDTGLFTQCANGPTGCAAQSVAGTISTCTSTAELVGTGMDRVSPPAHPDVLDVGSCGASNLLGGGTGWLTTSGNVVGGELITLRIAIWDTSDGIYDSVAIVDNFQWSVEASEPGTVLE
jgi:hypothetical protein